jgi:hypothetical protein
VAARGPAAADIPTAAGDVVQPGLSVGLAPRTGAALDDDPWSIHFAIGGACAECIEAEMGLVLSFVVSTAAPPARAITVGLELRLGAGTYAGTLTLAAQGPAETPYRVDAVFATDPVECADGVTRRRALRVHVVDNPQARLAFGAMDYDPAVETQLVEFNILSVNVQLYPVRPA